MRILDCSLHVVAASCLDVAQVNSSWMKVVQMQHRPCLREALVCHSVVNTRTCRPCSASDMQRIDSIRQAPNAPLMSLAKRHVWLCSLQKPLGTYNLTGTGKRMPKMWSENKYGAQGAMCGQPQLHLDKRQGPEAGHQANCGLH